MSVCFINIGIHTFNRKKYPRHILPPMDIGYAAAVLDKEGFKTHFIDLEIEKKNSKSISSFLKKENINVLIIKSDIQVIKQALDLIRKIKGKRKAIAMGPSMTLLPELFINKKSPIDIGIRYEPEYVLGYVLKSIKEGKDCYNLRGIVYLDKKIIINPKRSLINNLDKLPFPKHEFFLNKNYSFYYPTSVRRKQRLGFVLTSRGCPYSCAFCSPIKRNSYDKRYRQRSVENIIKELLFLKKKGITMVYFRDDLFNWNKDFILEFSKEMVKQKVGLSWAAQCRADLLDEEQTKIMKSAGCVCINTGIESASDRALKKINKKTTIKRISRGIKAAKRAGINVVGCFILGLPGDTSKGMERSIKYSKKLGLDMLQVLTFVNYPTKYKRQANIKNAFKDYEYYLASKSYCGVSVDKLKELYIRFYKEFYLRPSYILRYLYKNVLSLIINYQNSKALLVQSSNILLKRL